MPPVRYVGSTAVQFKITEDKDAITEPNDEDRTSFDTLTNREFLKKEGLTTFFTEWHDIPFYNKVKNERETNSILKKQVEKLQDKIFARPYVIDVEVLIQNKSIHKYTNIPMSEIRMRKSGSLNIDGYEPQPWDKKTDKCVYDYIIHTYGNIKGFKKVCNYNTISEVFGDDECYISGVNSWNIRAWCVEYNVPMSAFDDNERRFLNYAPPNRNKHAPSMLFRVSDGHFYPIPDDKRKSLITIATQIDASSDIMYKHIKEEKNKSVPITDVVILENTNPMYEVGKYMLETNTKPTSIVVNDGNLKSFKIKGITYTINQFVQLTKELCVNMNLIM